MPILTKTAPIIANKQLAGANVTSQIQGLRQQGGQLAGYTAAAFDQLQQSVNSLFRVLKTPGPALQSFAVVDSNGALIAWAGSEVVGNQTYEGIWAKDLYVGGTDASDAPFFADGSGNVIIGNNGSVQVQNPEGTQIGFIGVNPDPSLNIVNVTNDGTGLIKVQTATNTYITGDTVIISDVGGVTAANGPQVVTVIDSTHFTLNGSTFAGSYTTGGTVFRYYGGIWTQTAAFGGTGFSDAQFRVFANGDVLLVNATGGVTTTLNNLPDALGVAGIEIKDQTVGEEFHTVMTQYGFRMYNPSGGAVMDLTAPYSSATSYFPNLSFHDSGGGVMVLQAGTGLRFPSSSTTYGPSSVSISGGVATISSSGQGQFSTLAATNLDAGGIIQSTGGAGVLSLVSGGIPITKGGTGATTVAGALTNLGVYSSAQVDTLLAAKASHGTYGFSGTVSGGSCSGSVTI